MALSILLVKSILKYIIVIISLTGLLYQSSLLLHDYLSGKTVVAVRVEMIQFDYLPAITICTDKLLSMKKAKQIDHNLWQEYNDLADKYQKLGETDKNDNKTKIVARMREIYVKIM